MRNKKSKDGLKTTPIPGCATLQQIVITIKNKFRDNLFLGTTVRGPDGKLGEY
jgi:hypothetical protein